MTQQDIRNEIAKYNRIIDENLITSHFELNYTIKNALEEIAKLQQQCVHEYEKGICIWCGTMEGK